MLAFVFPGQGTQRPGMGQRHWTSCRAVAELFATANQLLGVDYAEICFGKRSALLASTEFAQPAIFLCNAAALIVAQEAGLAGDVLAGHSLGEMSAMWAAGALTFEDALTAVAYRGQLMQAAPSGAMLAVVGLPSTQVTDLCESTQGEGPVVVGLQNGPEHTVVSGAPRAVATVEAAVRLAGALRVMRLPTDRAFHSPLMSQVALSWENYISTVRISAAQRSVVLSTTGLLARDPDDIRRAMVHQITHPVLWTKVVVSLIGVGVTAALEVGESKMLRALIRMIDRKLEVYTMADIPELRSLSRLQEHMADRIPIVYRPAERRPMRAKR